MSAPPWLVGSTVALLVGLDRTAAGQLMLCRPLVAATLTGVLLGEAPTGLGLGVMLELLWVSRLPVGASVSVDDTQIAVGSTVLAVTYGPQLGSSSFAFAVLCLLLAMPFGKLGQGLERWVRTRNNRLPEQVEAAARAGQPLQLGRRHLRGLLLFALAGLVTYGTILVTGALLLPLLVPFFLAPLTAAVGWLPLVFVLIGAGVLLRTLHVQQAYWLFAGAFAGTFALLWLVGG